ncbi:DER1-domain-containing protein [Mytilinidion resinicola]|uniref:Derlin n=1 Tax=Mytilinidion resinicola TaxID=574789 RepID=A0A6A6YUD3_9PEZI|nr:DER1-domain-containing protein [Mytilinidion resinicola]KAF2811575.1 DER1-domain-containing protein [Mytilinidion resinicola]
MDVFWTLPPVSRTITAATVAVSALVYGGVLSVYPLLFASEYMWRLPPQIWRVVTAFLVTKPKLSIILDPYFLYTYASSLETESPRFTAPGDFFTYLVFVGLLIVASSGLALQGYFFLQPLTLALAYTYSQDNPHRKVSFFILTFDAMYLPYSMLFLTFVLEGPGAAMHQSMGLFAAHAFDFLTRIWPTFGGGKNYIQTPMFVKRAFGADNPAPRQRGYGTAIPPRDATAAPGAQRATGRGFGFGGQWNGRGPGRRLGGE